MFSSCSARCGVGCVVVLNYVVGCVFDRYLLHVFLSGFVCVGMMEVVSLVLCVCFRFGVFIWFGMLWACWCCGIPWYL